LACGVIVGPYTPDAYTLFLFHLDEAAGGTVTTNVGTMGGNAYSVNLNTDSGTPPTVTSVIGATSSYSGFTRCANVYPASTPGLLMGFDANGDGQFEADNGSGTPSADFIPMSELNMGNGGQTPWTLEAMICPSLTNGSVQQEIIDTDSYDSSRAFQFRINKSGQLEFNFITGTTGGTADIATAIPSDATNGFVANTWFHVAAAYDGTNVMLYWTKVNPTATQANLISTTAVGVGTACGAITGPLCIGGRNRGSDSEYFMGLIDEVRISSICRAANQMLFSPSANTLSATPTLLSPTNPVYAGEAVVMSSTVLGTQPIGYFWQGDGGSGGVGWTNLANSTTNSYTLSTAGMPAGSYEYRLVVTNAAGAVTNTPATLTLAAAVIQSVSVSPSNNPVYAGTPVTLSASLSGLSLVFLWQTDNGSGGATWNNLAGLATNTYALNTAGLAAATYQYRLVVTNTSGSATSAVVTLSLTNASGPLLTANTTITPATAYVGSTVLMSASFAGTQPMAYQWFCENGQGTTLLAGATNTTYSLASAQTNDAGSYFLLASNNPPGLGSQTLASTPTALSVFAVTNWGLSCELLEHPEQTVISASTPRFGWFFLPSFRDDAQAGYRIIVASSQALANAGTGDMWDSGVISNSASINVAYGGAALQPNTNYFWRVQTLDSTGQLGAFSAAQQFNTAAHLFNPLTNSGVIYQPPSAGSTNCYPIRYVAATPVLLTNTAPGQWFIDFGQDAFGYATVHANGNFSGTNVQAGFGEMASGDAVDTSPPDVVRYGASTFTLENGNVVYSVYPPSFNGNPDAQTISPPAAFGVVMPFRYLELTNFPGTLTLTDVVQERLESEFDTNAAAFTSSSANLNQVWNLCYNSMQWLAFDGIYVDGDRERTPYEADSYIHQLSSYAVNNEFTMPRCSFEYLTTHPTWPTEWKFHMILLAWADYLQTANTNLLSKYYSVLQFDSFTWAATGNGLMQGFPNFPGTTNSDIVDWPSNDRDGFVISSGSYLNWTNAVNNAFYYRGLQIMANIATVLGRTSDAATYAADATRVYSAYNATFWNSSAQCYVDGVGTTHASAHANFFPLAFGLVPATNQAAVVSYLHSRIAANNGMPPSVYAAQYLLEGLFQAGDADTALSLMATNGARSWMEMINLGSTLTDEAWSLTDKSNEDWNHAWGSAAGNLIARYVLGLQPVTAGYGQIVIQPQLGTTLSYVQGTVPTIRGPVFISVTNNAGVWQLLLDVPGNVTASVMLPATNTTALVDGAVVSGSLSNNWLTLTNIGSGQHAVWTSATSAPSLTTLYNNWASSWFGTNAGNSAIAGETADPDGDGMSNWAEFIAGTDPTDPASRLTISPAVSTNSLKVALSGRSGRSYTLQRSLTLAPLTWSNVVSGGILTSNQALYLADPSPPSAATFYRVMVTLP
jgi:hypothetical protein